MRQNRAKTNQNWTLKFTTKNEPKLTSLKPKFPSFILSINRAKREHKSVGAKQGLKLGQNYAVNMGDRLADY